MILAIDPGKDKCGLAVLTNNGEIIDLEICARQDLVLIVTSILEKYQSNLIVIGDTTFGREIKTQLVNANLKKELVLTSEKDSTWAGRQLYWQKHPPTGIIKFFPLSLRVPPRPIDDYAAVVIGRRFLTQTVKNKPIKRR